MGVNKINTQVGVQLPGTLTDCQRSRQMGHREERYLDRDAQHHDDIAEFSVRISLPDVFDEPVPVLFEASGFVQGGLRLLDDHVSSRVDIFVDRRRFDSTLTLDLQDVKHIRQDVSFRVEQPEQLRVELQQGWLMISSHRAQLAAERHQLIAKRVSSFPFLNVHFEVLLFVVGIGKYYYYKIFNVIIQQKNTRMGVGEGALAVVGRQRLRSGVLPVDRREGQWACGAQLFAAFLDKPGDPFGAAVAVHQFVPFRNQTVDRLVPRAYVDDQGVVELLVLLATFGHEPVQIGFPAFFDAVQVGGCLCQVLFFAVVVERAVFVAVQAAVAQLGRNGGELLVERFAKVRHFGHDTSSHGRVDAVVNLVLFYNFLVYKSMKVSYA